MLPIPARPGGMPGITGIGSSSSSSSTVCIASPRVEASASSTGRRATRWRSTQPFGPMDVSAVANVAASPVSPTTRVWAACASSSNCSRSLASTVGSGTPSSATHSAV